MKLYLLLLSLFVAAPAQAAAGTVLGMIFTVVFVVMLVLYWMVVAEVGDKEKKRWVVNVWNADEVFDPYRAEQVEVGVKYDATEYGGALSLFSTSKQTSVVKNNVFSTDGEQENQGIELRVFGMPSDNIRVVGGFTWLDAEMTKTQDGLLDGKTAIGVPYVQMSVNVEWDVVAVPGLTLDARAAYTSEQYASADNSLEVDASNRFDIGARYSFLVLTGILVGALLQKSLVKTHHNLLKILGLLLVILPVTHVVVHYPDVLVLNSLVIDIAFLVFACCVWRYRTSRIRKGWLS